MGGHGLNSSDTLVAQCEHDNEPSSSIKCGKSDYLRNHQLLKKVYTEDIPLLHKIHNKDTFNQHNNISVPNKTISAFNKMLYVLTIAGHHQAQIIKKEGNQIP